MMPESDPASVLLDIEARAHARQHALPPAPDSTRNLRPFLGFGLADARLVIAATQILKSPLSTRVPGAPPWLRGVAGLHGYPLPIIDFSSLCSLPEQASENDPHVLVIGHQRASCGLLVDSVYGLVVADEVGDSTLPELESGITAYLHGSCRSGDTLWGVVDPARIFHRLTSAEHLEEAG